VDFFDRVAVRRLCPKEARNLLKGVIGGSGVEVLVEVDPNTSMAVVGCGYRDEDAPGLSLERRALEDMARGFRPDMLAPCTIAVAMQEH